MSSENCARCLPDAHKTDFRQEGGDAVVKALAEYYDDARCSYIKTKLRLSQPQYTLLRDLLTKRYDPATASHVPLVIEGSMLEALPSLYHVNKFETDLIQHLGLQEGKRGKCASANVQTKFISDIEQHLKDGHLLLVDGKLVGEGGKPVVVAWSFDACRVFRGMKTTAFGRKPTGSTKPRSHLRSSIKGGLLQDSGGTPLWRGGSAKRGARTCQCLQPRR